MADIAIDSVLDLLPSAEPKPRRRRGENKGRHVSRAVRRRNRRGTNPRWQPSRAFKKFRIPRTTERAEALAEALDDSAVAPEEFWATDSSVIPWSTFDPHLQARVYEDERRLEEFEESSDQTPQTTCLLRLQGLRSGTVSTATPVVDVKRTLREFDLELTASGHVETPPDETVLEEIRQVFGAVIAA